MTQTLEEIRELINPMSHLPIFGKTDGNLPRQLSKRDELYFNFRYSRDSYKARKAGVHPVLMMAKRGEVKIRLYDDGSHQPTNEQARFASARFKAWGQKERELARELRKNERKSKNGRVNSFRV